MQLLQTFVLIIFFLVCAVLIFLVMIQSGKGGSVGIFGGGGSASPFGSSTMDVVTKATWYITATFFVLAIFAAIVFADSGPAISDDLRALEDMEDIGPQDSPTPNGTTGTGGAGEAAQPEAAAPATDAAPAEN
ncbi:MAG: preprotein translocase subunit SecG [bacterium]|nr:preprotein translocase subunit SecG [bacterium]